LSSPGISEEHGLPELLFSLASDDRLNLLAEVSAKRQRLTPLSKTIKATVQECSRHIERLGESGLVAKDAEGFYTLTSLGKAVLSLFPGMSFLLTNREYFLTHDLGYLPEKFVERVGELSGGSYVGHVSQVLELIKTIITDGREYVWLMADQPPIVGKVAGGSFFSKDIPVRLIGENVDRKVLSELRSAHPNSEVFLMKEVRVALAVNEKQAGICFPDPKGEADFRAGFAGKDERFLAWCRDLFEYYWKPLVGNT